MNLQLNQGESYLLFPTDEFREDYGWAQMRSQAGSEGLKARYVMNQTLPRVGGEWATFFTYFGGSRIQCSEGHALMDGILLRIRVPADRITLDKNKISVNGGLASSLIVDETHTPLVSEWLERVLAIKASDLVTA